MEVLKFEEILETFEAMDNWLLRCGLKAKNDRIHALASTIRRARDLFEKRQATGDSEPLVQALMTWGSELFFGLTEAVEFHDIFKNLSSTDANILGAKLARALSGPIRVADETRKNTDGRNIMFELALAAEWNAHRLDVQVGDPDITLVVSGVPFLLECKRPYDESGLRSNIRGAAKQLERKLDLPGAGRSIGIIAISVTRIFNRGDRFFFIPTEKWGQERLASLLRQLMRDSQRHWRTGDLHPRIVAVLFHISTPAFMEDSGLFSRMTYFTFVPIVEGPAYNLVADEIAKQYSIGRQTNVFLADWVE